MITLIKLITEDAIAQFVLAMFLGFISIAFFGEMLAKSEWVRDILIGKEGGEA